MPFSVGPREFIVVLVIVAMIFGIGKLPHISGSVGRAIWEFTRSQAEAEAGLPRRVGSNDETTTL